MKARFARQGYRILRQAHQEKKHIIPLSAYVSTTDKPTVRPIKREETTTPLVDFKLSITDERTNTKWQRLVLSHNDDKKEQWRRRVPFELLGLSSAFMAITSNALTESNVASNPESPEQKFTRFNQLLSRIKENDPTLLSLDLSDFSLELKHLEELNVSLKSNNQLGHIIWERALLPVGFEDIKKSIEDKLEENNKVFRYKPNDYVLALLSNHAYEELTDKDEGKPLNFALKRSESEDLKTKKKKWEKHLSKWQVHKVHNDRDKSGYFGVVYVNHETKQVILAHRGTDVKLTDLFKKSSPPIADIQSVHRANPFNSHMEEAYIATADIVKDVKEKVGALRGYHLTFTGHSLGAWLAEMSLYYCYSDHGKYFQHSIPRAVVFDSPGSKSIIDKVQPHIHNAETKFEIESLDIVTYLSVPNPVNICNEHVGTVYTVFPTVESSKSFVKSCIAIMISNNGIKGLESLATHSLTGIIDQFDPNTGKPKEYKEVKDWPLLERKPYVPKSSNILDVISNMVSEAITSRLPTSARRSAKKVVTQIFEDILHDTTIANIAELLDDLTDGRIDISKFFALQQYLDENYRAKRDCTIGQQFYVVHGHHFKLCDISRANPIGSLEGTIYWNLRQIIDFNLLERATHVLEPASIRQLKGIIAYCEILPPTIGSMGKAYVRLLSEVTLSIDEFKQRACRLMEVDKEIINLVVNRHRQVPTKPKTLRSAIPQIRDSEGRVKECVGRNEILQELQDKQIYKVIILHGHRGTGKSTVAKEYGLRVSASNKTVVRFIEENKVEQAFLEIADELDIATKGFNSDLEIADELDIATKGFNSEKIKKMVYAKLGELGKDVLLIFDNVDDKLYAEQVSKYLDDAPVNVRAVITTKNTTIKDFFRSSTAIRINDFNQEQAIEYLKRSREKKCILGSDEEFIKLIKVVGTEMGGEMYVSPLKVSLIEGAFTDKIYISEYIAKYNKMKSDGKKHPEFEIVLSSLFEEKSLSKRYDDWWNRHPAWKLLQYCTKLDTDFIPIDFFEQLGFKKDKLNQLIVKLASLGLIDEEVRNNKRGIKLHRLILEYIKEYRELHKTFSMKEEELVETTLMALNKAFTFVENESEVNQRKELEPLSGNVQAFIEGSLLKKTNSQEAASLISKYASYLLKIEESRFSEALEYFNEALNMFRSLYGERHLSIAITIDNIGNTYDSLGDVHKGFEYHEKSMKIRKLLHKEENHPDMAEGLRNLGVSYHNIGEHIVGIDYLLKSQFMYKALIKDLDDKDDVKRKIYYAKIADCLNKMGNIFASIRTPESAKESRKLFKQALSIRILLHGHIDHPDIANSLNNIGAAYGTSLGFKDISPDKYKKFQEKTLQHYEESFKIRQRLYKGRNHIYMADSLHNLGSLYIKTGRPTEGLEYLRRAQEMYGALFPAPHQRVAMSLLSLGIEYCRLDKMQFGIENLKKSLEMYHAIHPEQNHPDIRNCLGANGSNSFNLKEPEDIKNWVVYFTEAAERWKRFSSDKNDHPLMAWNAYCIGIAHEKLGNRRDAEKFFIEAYEIAKEIKSINPGNMKQYTESFDRYNNIWARMVTASRDICQDREIC